MAGLETHVHILAGRELLVVIDLDPHLERPDPNPAIEKIPEINGVYHLARHQVGRLAGVLQVEGQVLGPHAEDDLPAPLGALSALPSAYLGWMLAENTSHSGFELELHRWLGASTALLAVIAWFASRRWPQRRLLILLVLAGVVGATGHTGGVLSYGAAWLAPPF